LTKATGNPLSLVMLHVYARNYTLSRTLIRPAGFVQPSSVTIRVAVDGIICPNSMYHVYSMRPWISRSGTICWLQQDDDTQTHTLRTRSVSHARFVANLFRSTLSGWQAAPRRHYVVCRRRLPCTVYHLSLFMSNKHGTREPSGSAAVVDVWSVLLPQCGGQREWVSEQRFNMPLDTL